jgi:hypothetical protein
MQLGSDRIRGVAEFLANIASGISELSERNIPTSISGVLPTLPVAVAGKRLDEVAVWSIMNT